MSNKIKQANIDHYLKALNKLLGLPTEPYRKLKSGKIKANIGCIYVSGAYGGYKLEQIDSEGGGAREITEYRLTKRQLYEHLLTACNIARAKQYAQDSRKQERERKRRDAEK